MVYPVRLTRLLSRIKNNIFNVGHIFDSDDTLGKIDEYKEIN